MQHIVAFVDGRDRLQTPERPKHMVSRGSVGASPSLLQTPGSAHACLGPLVTTRVTGLGAGRGVWVSESQVVHSFIYSTLKKYL